MKHASRALVNLLNARRNLWVAELYRFDLSTGEQLMLSSADVRTRLRYRDLVMACRPIAYWTCADTSGQTAVNEVQRGVDGEWVGSPALGSALTLDLDPVTFVAEASRVLGSGKYLRPTGYAGSRPLQYQLDRAYTYELLVRPTNPSSSGDQILISNDSFFQLAWGWPGGGGLQAGHYTDRGWQTVAAPPTAHATTYHIAVTYDGHHLALWIDGELIQRKRQVRRPMLTDPPYAGLTIGCSNARNAFTTCSIGHVAMYDYALTPREILTHADCARVGLIFAPTMPVRRGATRQSRSLEVDTLELHLYPRERDTLGVAGIPFWQAVRNGALDDANFVLYRAFAPNAPRFPNKIVGQNAMETPTDEILDVRTPPAIAWPTGAVALFTGVVGPASGGLSDLRLMIEPTVSRLNTKMPRYLYTPGCNWELFSPGCGLDEDAYRYSTSAKQGSTATRVEMTAVPVVPDGYYTLGRIVFLTGANAYVKRLIKSHTGGVLTLARPLPYDPEPETALFYVLPGCRKTMDWCEDTFNNLNNFRGFPFVPPPETIIGVPVEENRGEE